MMWLTFSQNQSDYCVENTVGRQREKKGVHFKGDSSHLGSHGVACGEHGKRAQSDH